MSRRKISRDLLKLPGVVAAVHSPGALLCARKIRRGEVDFVEIRVDNFAADPGLLLKVVPQLELPLILTVRHPKEGGAHELSLARRRELFEQFLPYASLIDVELRSFEALAGTLQEARAMGAQVIASFHDFRATPAAARLQKIIRQARAAGADVCKIAARADSPAALGRLLAPLGSGEPFPLSMMGMGRFGKISRLLFAQAGSILNYGYLDRPNASGQWEARLLKKRIAELTAE